MSRRWHEWGWLQNGWCVTGGHNDVSRVAEHGNEAPTVDELNLLWCPSERDNWLNGSRVKP